MAEDPNWGSVPWLLQQPSREDGHTHTNHYLLTLLCSIFGESKYGARDAVVEHLETGSSTLPGRSSRTWISPPASIQKPGDAVQACAVPGHACGAKRLVHVGANMHVTPIRIICAIKVLEFDHGLVITLELIVMNQGKRLVHVTEPSPYRIPYVICHTLITAPKQMHVFNGAHAHP